MEIADQIIGDMLTMEINEEEQIMAQSGAKRSLSNEAGDDVCRPIKRRRIDNN